MKKFAFVTQNPCNSYRYCFFASLENDIVEYEIDDELFSYKRNKGKLNKDNSKKFIEYIKKAEIWDIENKIEKQQEQGLYVYCTDMPYYDVAYMNNDHIEMASWYAGDFGTAIEEQKYIYLAMMLCDENAISFILSYYEDINDLRKFKGEIKSFSFIDDAGSYTQIDGCTKQTQYTNIADLKDRLNIIFKNQNQLDIDEIEDVDWQVILINENDEIFSYLGDYKHYENMKALSEWAKENVKNLNTKKDVMEIFFNKPRIE